MKSITVVLLLLVALGTVTAAQKPSTMSAGSNVVDWRTPAERSDYRTTPRYDETMAYVRRVAAAAPGQVRVEVFGKTGEGRELVDVVVSRDGVFDPETLHRAARPILLIQNAIHAGEMDGKDSCLALLRDMVLTKTQARLLEHVVVVIIPIYNADGHERFGPYNRINQNGPEEMGWRVNATNLNLNRDYVKAEAPETRAWLKLWNRWLPDFFVDDHVTDGADYQYNVTYGLSTGAGNGQAVIDWQQKSVAPYLDKSVAASGHVIGPLIFLKDDVDPTKGIERFPSTPRFSDGYVVLQNRPGMLVEMHMLKDYKTRVTGNYEYPARPAGGDEPRRRHAGAAEPRRRCRGGSRRQALRSPREVPAAHRPQQRNRAVPVSHLQIHAGAERSFRTALDSLHARAAGHHRADTYPAGSYADHHAASRLCRSRAVEGNHRSAGGARTAARAHYAVLER